MTVRSSRLVVITGAAGFLGRHASLAFAQRGWRVIGIGNGKLSARDQASLGMSKWRQGPIESGPIGELIDEYGVPDVVVHAAGSSSVRAAADDPDEDFRRTVGGTVELLKALRCWAPETCLVLTSSAAIYGNDHPNPIPEEAAPAPISIYGRHKRQAEERCLAAMEQYGLRLAIVRLFSLYGSGLRKQIYWDLWNKMAGDGPIVLGGTGRETRDFLHVYDAVQLLLRAVEHTAEKSPLILNGGTGKAITIRDAATLMQRLCNCQAEIQFDDVSRPGDPVHLVAETGRLRAIGWYPRVELLHGLTDYVAWVTEGANSEAATRYAPSASRLVGAL